jgi:hypothetical protein
MLPGDLQTYEDAVDQDLLQMNFPWFRGVEKDLEYTTPRKRVSTNEESATHLHN